MTGRRGERGPPVLLLLLVCAASGSLHHRHGHGEPSTPSTAAPGREALPAPHHGHHHGHHHARPAPHTHQGLQSRPAPEDNSVDIDSPSPRLYPGRRVCSRREVTPRQEKVRETYCRPRMLPYSQRCAGDQICRGVRMVCETAYRDVLRTRVTPRASFACCPGWSARRASPYGCDSPVCHPACENGGSCQRPGLCQCPPGYTGPRCQTDVDECDESAVRRCDHVCSNTAGSYRCECRPGYALQPDGRSCQPLGKPPGIAPDPTDGDFEFLAKKLARLEQILLVRQRHELEEEAEDSEVELTSAAAAANAVAKLSARIDAVQTEVQQLRQAEHQRCAHIQERLTRLEDVCSRIALVERKVHHLTGGCSNRNSNQVWP